MACCHAGYKLTFKQTWKISLHKKTLAVLRLRVFEFKFSRRGKGNPLAQFTNLVAFETNYFKLGWSQHIRD